MLYTHSLENSHTVQLCWSSCTIFASYHPPITHITDSGMKPYSPFTATAATND